MINGGLRKLLLLACLAAAGSAHADFNSSLGPISAPASLAFSNATDSHLSIGTLAAPDYNFLDRWTFNLGGDANLTSLVAAFSFADTFGISNIQVNLLDAIGVVATGWQTVTMSGPFATTVSVTPASPLAVGNYTLQVRGHILGAPASYSGTLIAAAPAVVPLPAALPLLLVGLGAFGAVGKRKRG